MCLIILVALFAEMYGFPLTIYFLSSVLGINLPSVLVILYNFLLLD